MLKTFIGALTLGIMVTAAAATHADDNACTIATKGDNVVVKACKEGGRKRAKTTMKAMAKVAKDKGFKTECDTCHKNEENWELTKNADADFKKMLDLQK